MHDKCIVSALAASCSQPFNIGCKVLHPILSRSILGLTVIVLEWPCWSPDTNPIKHLRRDLKMAAHQLSSNLNLRESAKNSVRTRLNVGVQSSQHRTPGGTGLYLLPNMLQLSKWSTEMQFFNYYFFKKIPKFKYKSQCLKSGQFHFFPGQTSFQSANTQFLRGLSADGSVLLQKITKK